MRRSAKAMLLICGLVGISSVATAQPVRLQGGMPLGILDRVFQILFADAGGACFAMDVDGRQYLVTARQVVPGIQAGDRIRLRVGGKWFELPATPIFPERSAADTVALALEQIVAPRMEVAVGSGIGLGQDVYLLGFPFGLGTPVQEGGPVVLPFVKKGVMSAARAGAIYLDSQNNPGFSGGPVVFADGARDGALTIGGVIAGYRNQPLRMLELKEAPVPTDPDTPADAPRFVLENTGVVVAYGILEIERAIRENPIGALHPEPAPDADTDADRDPDTDPEVEREPGSEAGSPAGEAADPEAGPEAAAETGAAGEARD